MLDATFVRENLDAVKENCRNRNVKVDIDRIAALIDQRRQLIHQKQLDEQQANQNKKQVPQEQDPAKRQALIERGRTLREAVDAAGKQLDLVEAELDGLLKTIPNMSHPDAPVGTTAEDNKVIERWGEPTKFDFPPKDHVALGEALDLVDFEAGASVAGQKFYFLKNEAVLLEMALVQYAMEWLIRAGYTPIITPDLARTDVLEGIGFLPRDPNPETRQVYAVADSDLCLIATAEITLGGMRRNKTLDEA